MFEDLLMCLLSEEQLNQFLALSEKYFRPLRQDEIQFLQDFVFITEEQRMRWYDGIEQGSDEWHQARKMRINASEVGHAVGNGIKYKTPQQQAEHMVKYALDSNFTSITSEYGIKACAHGHLFEPLARAMVELWLSHKCNDVIQVQTRGSWISPLFWFLAASIDGDTNFVHDDYLVEIKCPFKGTVYGDIPDTYFDQITTQMALTGKKKCLFVVYTAEMLHVQEYHFNELYWETFLLPKLYSFYFDTFVPLFRNENRKSLQ